ncbi:MAG: cation-translocating P-type ATPase, partial [Minisyncoccales bacterium]
MKYYLKSKEELFREFNTNDKGLSKKEAKQRIKKYGYNKIKQKNKLQSFKILFEQFNSYLIYILLFSSIIMFFFNKFLDAIVIFAIILLNGGIGFAQQYKAEKAILGLKKMIIPKTMVLREGIFTEVSSSQLVPGDIIVFDQGDKVNTDCRIIESQNLQTDEAALTGESMPVSKNSEIIKEQTELANQKNMLFTGTRIVKGEAKALVVLTGSQTVFGNIADTLQDIKTQKTPMQKRLDVFSKQLSYIIFALVLFIFILGYFQDFPIIDLFMTSVTLAIGAIPEGLPAVLAITFAISSVLMSRQNVIIRKLPAVETLGSVTVICSDKTGTITEEKMAVQKMFSGNSFYNKKGKNLYKDRKKIEFSKKNELNQLLKTSILCNNSKYEFSKGRYNFLGDPTENALLSSAIDLGLDKNTLAEKEPV